MFLCLGLAQAQDVYFAGNSNGEGRIWKNNTLVYSISDTTSINLADMKLATDGSFYSVGHRYSNGQGFVWLNDSVLFTTETGLSRLVLTDEGWTASSHNRIWQNGELLYAYEMDSTTVCNIYAIATDTTTGDLYAGGSVVTPAVYASVWKNDSLLWQCDGWSAVNDLCLNGENLYAAGFVYGPESIDGAIWNNDSIVFQLGNANFTKMTSFEGSIYWAGNVMDTSYIWQNGEVIYTLADAYSITALSVNEFGVYYAAQYDSVATVWKNGEVIYEIEDCDIINALAVLPSDEPLYTLAVESGNPEWGTVTGGGMYHFSDTATIEAIPNTGREFIGWNDGNSDNPREVIILQDSTFVAHFGTSQFIIKVESDHPAWGTVEGGGTFYYGDTIQIAATSNLGFAFAGWTDGDISNPRTVVVTENQTFIAHFEIKKYTITTKVVPEGSGTVNGGGIYEYGETIHLVAHSNTGYVFSIWEDGEIANPRSVFVEGDATYVAVFDPLQYEITTECDPVEGGTVTGGGTYHYGETASLRARANENYMFLCWSDGIVSNPRNVTVTQSATYRALFHLNGTQQYTVTVEANDPTLGTVAGSGTYPEGATIEISATPNEGVDFLSWDDGSIENPRSVVVTGNLSFKAIFFSLMPTYTINVISDSPLMGSVYGEGVYPANSVIQIGALPNQGFYFSGWQDGDMNNPRTITVTENATYIAYFSANPVETYTVTVYYDDHQGFVIGAGTYTAGTVASLAAIPADDYMFVKWSDNTTDNPKEVLVDRDIVLAAFFDGTGVEENGLGLIKLYPNPANDKICIEGVESESQAEVYNAFGMKVKSLNLNGDSEISISDIASGLYIIRIGRHATKFVKE